MNVKLIWATPDIDAQIMYIARVSNPKNQDSNDARLLYYLMSHGHVSPFEMVHACLEINTTRDIARQILRHRSFSFQEFSQRYADVTLLSDSELRECRLQDARNRQNSLPCYDEGLSSWWAQAQKDVMSIASRIYKEALNAGIAKEQARAVLPEGLTTTRLYMSGTIRSWVHYLKQRLDPSTQKEHRDIASEVLKILRAVAPVTMAAFFGDENVNV